MPDPDFPDRGALPSGSGGPCGVDELIERAQRLGDMARPYDGFPLPWHVEAWHVGDLTALATTALRTPR